MSLHGKQNRLGNVLTVSSLPKWETVNELTTKQNNFNPNLSNINNSKGVNYFGSNFSSDNNIRLPNFNSGVVKNNLGQNFNTLGRTNRDNFLSSRNRNFPTSEETIDFTQSDDFSFGTLGQWGTGVGIAGDLAGIGTGILGVGLARETFDFNKDVANVNIENQSVAISRQVGDQAFNRAKNGGATDAQANVAAQSAVGGLGLKRGIDGNAINWTNRGFA